MIYIIVGLECILTVIHLTSSDIRGEVGEGVCAELNSGTVLATLANCNWNIFPASSSLSMRIWLFLRGERFGRSAIGRLVAFMLGVSVVYIVQRVLLPQPSAHGPQEVQTHGVLQRKYAGERRFIVLSLSNLLLLKIKSYLPVLFTMKTLRNKWNSTAVL